MVRKTMAGVAALAMSLALSACGDDGATTKAASTTAGTASSAAGPATPATPAGGLKISVLPKAINNPYFDASFEGAKKACEEIKAECEYVGPSESTGAAQLEFLSTLIQKKPDAIVISAADANAVTPALKQAAAAGITIVTYDADVADASARSLMITPSSTELIGAQQVKWASELAGPEGGEVAILSAAATAENQNKWIDVMKAELKKPEYAKLKLVDTVYGDDDAAKSAEKAAGLLQAHPKLKVIIAPTTVGIREAGKYISGSQYKGKVHVTGLGLPSEMAAYVKDGTVQKFGLWNPVDLGYIAVHAASQIKAGSLKPASGGKFTAGTFEGGELTIGEKNNVVVGPPFEFNKENIDQFKF